jgi:thiol-disulfide isomerase/thioredoxin
MKHPLRLMGTFVALALSLVWLATARPSTARGDVAKHEMLLGKPAVDFRADFAVNGKVVRLADKALRNKVVLLVFWGIWSGPSRDILAPLQQWYKDHQSKGLEILGLTAYNIDFNRKVGFDKRTGRITKIDNPTYETDRQMLQDFAAARKIKFPLLKLPKAEVERLYKQYGVSSIPQLVLIDPAGRVRMVRVGSSEETLEAIGDELRRLYRERK